MSVTVKLNDVIEALDAAGDQLIHYLDKRTGEIVPLTNDELEAAEQDELISEYPDWQRENILKAREVLSSEDFLALPSAFDVHEYKIMEDFCLEFEHRDLLRLIKGSGAFRRFKNAILSRGLENRWNSFRLKEIEKIAIQWLEEVGISYSREDSEDVSGMPM
ncbi:MAG: UPF0158 family protein [Pyrinomonadaceae bacterium]